MPIFNSEKSFLKNYDIHDYDLPLTTVDMAIFTVKDSQLQVLLVKRAQHPALGKWALPGGFIDLKRDKTLDDTARRKLEQKTGVKTPYLEQVETFGSASRDPRAWAVTVAYLALIASEGIALQTSEATEQVMWAPVKSVETSYTLAFDHSKILQHCHTRLKNKVQYTSLPVNLLPDEFTLTALQRIFEIILDKGIEKKSFRRRIEEANILEETGGMKIGNNRPAKLYRVKPEVKTHFFNRNIEGARQR